MGKKKKKPKKSCCGKYLKKGRHCSRCPVLIKAKCRELTREQEKGKAARKKKKKKKKDKK
ncbi:MAG TPA: hypothetical protein ENK27_08060 [Desulfobulbus sp.]|nr:hypothetical protein [Desulfobulbus sp.]